MGFCPAGMMREKITLIKMDDERFFFEISGLAAQVWDRIDGEKSLAQIRDKVLKLCEIDAPILESEILKFSKKLLSEGLVFEAPKSP